MDLSLIKNLIKELVPDTGDMTKEGSFVFSLVISLTFFGVFIWITGDVWAGISLSVILEIILLYVLHVT
jgi:hypothetical protein